MEFVDIRLMNGETISFKGDPDSISRQIRQARKDLGAEFEIKSVQVTPPGYRS